LPPTPMSTENVKRAESLWFSDGSIVLQAGNTQFKVFHGILSVRSAIFRDMLALPQPQDAQMVEGCPLVRLSDDETETTAFLNAIYHPSSFPSFPNLTDIDTVLGCLSLAHKYEVDDLRRRALVHLSSGFPTTVSDWKAFKGGRASKGRVEAPDVRLCSWVKYEGIMQHLRTIRIARTVDALWILPYAFILMLLRDSNNSWRAFATDDVDPVTIWNGQVSMIKAAVIGSLASFSDPLHIEGCTNELACLRRRLEESNSLRDIMKTENFSLVSLFVVVEAIIVAEAEAGRLCSECAAVLGETQKAALQKFWDDLPGFYKLPSWPELERMKADAIGPNIFC
ncbi:hypothetical protein C8F01DRAFT_987242, partial [Mycena amicta]